MPSSATVRCTHGPIGRIPHPPTSYQRWGSKLRRRPALSRPISLRRRDMLPSLQFDDGRAHRAVGPSHCIDFPLNAAVLRRTVGMGIGRGISGGIALRTASVMAWSHVFMHQIRMMKGRHGPARAVAPSTSTNDPPRHAPRRLMIVIKQYAALTGV